jgi:hypothetical protein
MSFKFKVTTTPLHLNIPDSTKIKTNEIYLEENLNQMKARLDANGRPLPDGIDLYDSGDLQGSGKASVSGWSFEVSYAGPVEDNFHYKGLSPQSKARADARISELWKTEPLTAEQK